MKLTIVIPSFNQAHFIGQTLDSIFNQEVNVPIEVLVIDGGSTDGTVELLKKFGDRISWVSEADKGQADAVNKGVKMAKGNIIGWLNSDDVYLPGTLQKVITHFSNNPECQWLYGKCRIVDSDGNEIWKWVTLYKNLNLKKYSYNSLLRENYISQPAVFFSKQIFDELGPLDLSLNFALDYDLWLRFGAKYQPAVIDEYLSDFRRHGTSKSETDFKSQFLEQYAVAKNHGASGYNKLMHKFNIYKIISAYQLFKIFS